MIPGVSNPPTRDQLLVWTLWAACGVALAAAAVAVFVPYPGQNRIAGTAAAFVFGAAALAALALLKRAERLLSLILYGVAALALTYGLMSAGSVPLRLSVLGTCPAPPHACPAGFEQPLSNRENLAFEGALLFGGIALLVSVLALEMQFQPRLRVFGRSQQQATTPPPEMKPSAIVKSPPPSEKEPETTK